MTKSRCYECIPGSEVSRIFFFWMWVVIFAVLQKESPMPNRSIVEPTEALCVSLWCENVQFYGFHLLSLFKILETMPLTHRSRYSELNSSQLNNYKNLLLCHNFTRKDLKICQFSSMRSMHKASALCKPQSQTSMMLLSVTSFGWFLSHFSFLFPPGLIL